MEYSDPFFTAGIQIVDYKRAAQDRNVRLVRWQDHGIFFAADVSPAVRNALCVPMPSEADWEKISLELHSRIPAEEKSVSSKKLKSFTIKNFNRS
jgi:hypothetical protein